MKCVLSALLLSKLMVSITTALQSELPLQDPVCFTDSKASLYWIQGTSHEWKQFVENRVTTIRSLVPPQHWRHCPGTENPADIPSRGMSASTVAETSLWLEGPHWLYCGDYPQCSVPHKTQLTDECRTEVKQKESTHSLTIIISNNVNLSQIIKLEDYSSSHHLFRVTALVLKFVDCICDRLQVEDSHRSSASRDLDEARLLWVKRTHNSSWRRTKTSPCGNANSASFETSIWRCSGRMSYSSLTLADKLQYC